MTPYSSILSPNRFRISSAVDRDIISEAESDRGRLLFCAAFRRLQQKAQVFSMEPNAAVRSRLTHSLEVSQMGRYIADLVAKALHKKKLATEDECTALVTFVETACLMHDIGNPPFGHFGEAAISTWFHDNGPTVVAAACSVTEEAGAAIDPRIHNALTDFWEFDGNPQGLRVVAKLQRNNDEYGLNLTKTTLASYLKYVRSSGRTEGGGQRLFTKKCGYFKTEKAMVEEIWKNFDYKKPRRFPLAYIMEAADDLAYCISDLEDSIEKGFLDKDRTFVDIYKKWQDEIKTIAPHPSRNNISDILEQASRGALTYTDFRTKLNRVIVKCCAEQYIKKHKQVLAGSLTSLIQPKSPSEHVLNLLRDYCKKRVYCHESVQRIELAGYAAIYGLLDSFKCLLSCNHDRFRKSLDYINNNDGAGKKIVIEKKLLALFPKNYKKIYLCDVNSLDKTEPDFSFREWALRAHLITDFISGMTDDFAMTTYRTLSGMRL